MTAPVPFDGVIKMGGVWASAGAKESKGVCWITVKDCSEGVRITIPDYHAPIMTVAEARSLAAQIMEVARRHEIRKGLQSK